MAMDEVQRIKDAYDRRDASGIRKLYSLLNPSALFADQRREEEILQSLRKAGLADMSQAKILDLGCGTGHVLRSFLRYGVTPENCFGVDLLPSRIDEAKRLSPNMNFQCGNGETLPHGDARFDVVLCFTVFSSIFDPRMKQHIAAEMMRVLKPGGIILWYDYHMNNPRNPDVRGVKKSEVTSLFSGCTISFRGVTLAPPLARALAPYSVTLCRVLEKMKFLNTHYIAVIRKKIA
jgi:ubiquinone/menaquinone biosynthesis C-methylase UbiE